MEMTRRKLTGAAVVGGKWSLPKAGKVAFTKDKSDLDTSKFGENPAGLKLCYAAKTGAFKGSFSLYRETAARQAPYHEDVSGGADGAYVI